MPSNYSLALQNAHDTILKRIKMANSSHEDAKEIEKYFQLIKARANNNSHPVLKQFDNAFIQEIDKIIINSNFPKNLFTLTHEQGLSQQTKKADDIFELQLGIVLRKLASSQGVSGKISLTGTSSYNIDLFRAF